MFKNSYNPDVLDCLASLSSDEVFTPPNLVNDILDMLPQSLWNDKDSRFLDPVCKSGVFLREIAKRLDEGLKETIPDKQKRINHILSNQLYGIAITELTSLLARRAVYCTKTANGKYSVCDEFSDKQGNILFNRIEHTWDNGKCIYCRASQTEYDRGEDLETHAYHFIHTENPEEVFKMKFDVIIGNPPYQLSDGGFGRSATPIYQMFVQQAKKLAPRYLVMIIPARWFAGGKGLDGFRLEMLNDNRIRKLVDFENSSDIFPGVDVAGGICFFLWERDAPGQCEVTNHYKSEQVKVIRSLNEFCIFIRHSQALPIIRKVLKSDGVRRLSDVVSSRNAFGLQTNYNPKTQGIPCWYTQRVGLKYATEDDLTDKNAILSKWKLLIPQAPIAGQTDFSKPVGFYYLGNTRIAKPGQCCTDSWIVACAFSSESEVCSFRSYLFTKTVRFLLLQAVVSQHVTKQKFLFVPDLGKYEIEYTDAFLRERWDITADEWEFIDYKVKSIETDNE